MNSVLLSMKDEQVTEALRKYGAFIVLILFTLFNIAFTPNFFTFSNFNNIMGQVAPGVMVAVGMTIVISTKGFDLSVGGVVALVSIIVGLSIPVFGAVLAILIGLLFAAVLGAISGTIIAYLKISPIVVTLALMSVYRGIGQIISNGTFIDISDRQFLFIGQAVVFGLRIQIWIALVVVLIVAFVMKKTTYARFITAIGSQEKAAFLSGIKVERVKMSVYVICAVLAAIAGMTEMGKLAYGDALSFGMNWELDAIAATAIGGTSLMGGRPRIGGTVAGAILVILINATVNMNNIPFDYAQVFKAVVIMLALLFQMEKRV